LRPRAVAAYDDVSGGAGTLGIDYVSSLGADLPQGREEIHGALIAGLLARRREEIDRGITLLGPHRDDVALAIGDLPAKGYASHGESWSVALSLRLSSYDLLRHESDGDPVLILDDVFAELDVTRRARLADRVAGAEQVLITAAVPADVPTELRGVTFDVTAGQVSRAA
jgi:DNA replication and repair protein RecF